MTEYQEPTMPGQPTAIQHESGLWFDEYGIIGFDEPGTGRRSSPREAFPTGPAVGEAFPSIVATNQSGEVIDVHAARGAGPAVVVFSRATYW